jgi:hypothetical protein
MTEARKYQRFSVSYRVEHWVLTQRRTFFLGCGVLAIFMLTVVAAWGAWRPERQWDPILPKGAFPGGFPQPFHVAQRRQAEEPFVLPIEV